jgi:hypothetical protein
MKELLSKINKLLTQYLIPEMTEGEVKSVVKDIWKFFEEINNDNLEGIEHRLAENIKIIASEWGLVRAENIYACMGMLFEMKRLIEWEIKTGKYETN